MPWYTCICIQFSKFINDIPTTYISYVYGNNETNSSHSSSVRALLLIHLLLLHLYICFLTVLKLSFGLSALFSIDI